MANNPKNNSTQPTTPVTGQQPIMSGGQVIQRPTSNTSTERTLKESIHGNFAKKGA